MSSFRSVKWSLALAVATCAAASSRCVAAPARPAPAKGTNSRTLIIHNAARSPYTLGHELEFLKLQLQRVDTQLESIPSTEATAQKIAGADYLVLFLPASVTGPAAPLELLVTNKPLLWVGFGGERMADVPSHAGQVAPALAAEPALRTVAYRGRDWDASGAFWHPMRLPPTSEAEPLITVSGEGQDPRLAICWRHEQTTVFSAVPGVRPLQPLFADVLLDFFGVKKTSESRLLLRIDDYETGSNHREFKRMVDFLFSRGHAFVLPITPSWRNEETGVIEDLESAPEFVSGLRYAQQRGGRIVLRGCLRETGDRTEFWDMELDRPRPELRAGEIRKNISRAVGLLVKNGLLPIAWQTPQDSASRMVHQEVARCFSTCVERPQLSDATRLGQGLVSSVTMDQYGRMLLPENLGYVSGGSPEAITGLKRRAEILTRLRGTVAGCRFHAYLPLEKLIELVGALEQLKTPFLDLADLDHWIHVPGYLLLSGRAQHAIRISADPFARRTYDRNGKVISSLSGRVALGESVFQREGAGDYELFEFTESNP